MLTNPKAHIICHQFYGYPDSPDYSPPDSTLADVERVILEGGVDKDHISRCDWVHAVMSDDTPYELLEYILKHKDVDAIKPLYDIVSNTINGILDKE